MDVPESIASETDLVSYLTSYTYMDKEPEKMQDNNLEIIDCHNNQPVPLLELSDISFHYPGYPNSDALSGVSLNVYSGECIALVGASGSGKSTLFSHMNGLLKPDQGRILFRGKDIWDQDYSRKRIGQLLDPRPLVRFVLLCTNKSKSSPNWPTSGNRFSKLYCENVD